MSAHQRIEDTIKKNKIVLFMKGNPSMPQCGFSAATVRCLQDLNVPFESVDVLSDPEVREEVKAFSNWPTIPQVYIGGEFVGGCDIVRELHSTGELKKMVDKVLA